MDRRNFLTMSGVGLAGLMMPFGRVIAAEDLVTSLDIGIKKAMADAALQAARDAGASYCDVRIGRYLQQFVITREDKVQNVVNTESTGIGIRVQPLAVENLASALDDDEVDLAVVAVDLPLRNWHRRTEWLRCGFNCIFAPAHLQLPPSPTLADLAACDHVVSSYRGDATSTLDQLFAAHGLSRRVVASLASMASIMGTLRQSPLLTIQPDLQLGHLLDMQGLTSIPLCSNPPVEISIGGVWHHRHDRNARHRYIRERMGSVVRALRAPAG